MRVDFYVLGQVPAARIVTALAAKVRGDDARMVITHEDAAARAVLSKALWEAKPESFLANGDATAPHADRQPLLLSDGVEPVNGAKMLCLADGIWREAEGYDRIFYLFGPDRIADARVQWKAQSEAGTNELGFWKQDEDGKWIEGP